MYETIWNILKGNSVNVTENIATKVTMKRPAIIGRMCYFKLSKLTDALGCRLWRCDCFTNRAPNYSIECHSKHKKSSAANNLRGSTVD